LVTVKDTDIVTKLG